MPEYQLTFQDWIDAELKQAHLVAARANALADEMLEALKNARADILAQLAILQDEYLDADAWGEVSLSRKQAYLEAQRDAINSLIGEVYAGMGNNIQNAAGDVMTSSIATTARFIGAAGALSVTPSILKSWIATQTVDGLLINEWLDKLGRATADRIIKAGRQALIGGYGVRKTAALLRREGVEMAQPGLEAVARTFLQSAANTAREDAIERAAGDLIKGWEYTAILDGRTCLVCGADDGRLFPVDKKDRPQLPRHINCRCLYLPALKSFRDIGIDIDDVKRADRNALKHESRKVKNDDGSRSTRFRIKESDTFGGNYEQWLKTQLDKDPAFVRKILGKTRFELFKSGKLLLSKMVVNERIKRLSELERQT